MLDVIYAIIGASILIASVIVFTPIVLVVGIVLGVYVLIKYGREKKIDEELETMEDFFKTLKPYK